MKVVIFAGGHGTRFSEETQFKPKPMIEIGDKPILWHIMKIYSHYGYNDFIILSGYQSHYIKNYFVNYYCLYSDITVDLASNAVELHKNRVEPWKVTILYTGENTMTASRLAKAREYIGGERFMLTYGDGLANININDLLKAHDESGKIATITAVQPGGRFGALEISGEGRVASFREKPLGDNSWINGGFFVLEPEVFSYLDMQSESEVWEQAPLNRLAAAGELNAFRHSDFWHPMDTLRENKILTDMWKSGKAPWKVWE